MDDYSHENLEKIGGYFYTDKEKAFAEKIAKTLGAPLDTRYVEGVVPYSSNSKAGGSTDVGDVSFAVPTVGLRAATWVPGTSSHSWQAVAAGGTSIGIKGMMVAAKTLALTGMQLLDNPKAIETAKKEFLEKRGLNYQEGDMGETYGFNFRHFGGEYQGCHIKYEKGDNGFDQLENVNSIAFVSMGTGIYRWPIELAADIAVKELKKSLYETTIMCVVDEKMKAMYESKLTPSLLVSS